MAVSDQRPPPKQLYSRERDPIPIVQETVWASGPVWTGTENFAPTGIRSLDHRARSESQYQLPHPRQLFNDLCIPPVV